MAKGELKDKKSFCQVGIIMIMNSYGLMLSPSHHQGKIVPLNVNLRDNGFHHDPNWLISVSFHE